ncbi:NUDIX hydrolase family protein [Thalassospira sp. MCCC 1A03138]|uniref:NUDIX hydrolase n=1 Tax=Thalassospira sp. MCCC 1A03138 TaxID=1470576 RepID=UPI000A1DC902|nr:NUDIX hydrolase family protein [Thalassospira sp. MCCC 1A03138]OSQ28810.1 NTP pyrophosphohydrolase [Thalassospira sp. MCCC 1A03138]
MTYLDHIKACNNANPSRYVPFRIDGMSLGALRPDFATALSALGPDFSRDENGEYCFAPHIVTLDDRNRSLDTATKALCDQGVIRRLHGERFDIRPTLGHDPLCQLDRSAMPYFGFRSWGVHMNGYVQKDEGIHMWIAHRAKDKPTYPGMLDNMVAGGQPTGLGFLENMIKECAEEAAIPENLSRNLKPVGTVSYLYETTEGLKPDVMVNYDLELPADFVPRCADGEVEQFELMPLADVAEIVRSSFDFKFNCALVIIDFLIRHGFLTADNEPDYSQLTTGLHRNIFR